MDPELARRIHAVFTGAVEIEGADHRRAFVEAACAGDPRLRRGVAELLRAIEASGTFLEAPALGSRATDGRTGPSPTRSARTTPPG